MYADPSDGLPQVGSHKRCLLGVRPTGANADIELDPAGDVNGNVVVNRMGLSVSRDWRQLPGHMIPEELEDDTNAASGKGMKVYVHGDGDFIEGDVTESLEMLLKPNRMDSGVVCPKTRISLSQYQADLQATRTDWVADPS